MKISRQGKHPHNNMMPLERVLVAPPKDDGEVAPGRGRVWLSNFS